MFDNLTEDQKILMTAILRSNLAVESVKLERLQFYNRYSVGGNYGPKVIIQEEVIKELAKQLQLLK